MIYLCPALLEFTPSHQNLSLFDLLVLLVLERYNGVAFWIRILILKNFHYQLLWSLNHESSSWSFSKEGNNVWSPFEVTIDFSTPKSLFYLDISLINGALFSKEENKKHILCSSSRSLVVIKKRENDRLMLEFWCRNKMDAVPNVELPLVVTATITNRLLSQLLIDDRTSNDIMYIRIFGRLWLLERCLTPYEGKNLLEFNDYSTHPFGVVELLISIRDGRENRNVDIFFLEIPYERVYTIVLGSPFFVVLDVVALIVNLNMTYHDDLGNLVVISIDLRGAPMIH